MPTSGVTVYMVTLRTLREPDRCIYLFCSKYSVLVVCYRLIASGDAQRCILVNLPHFRYASSCKTGNHRRHVPLPRARRPTYTLCPRPQRFNQLRPLMGHWWSHWWSPPPPYPPHTRAHDTHAVPCLHRLVLPRTTASADRFPLAVSTVTTHSCNT